MPPSRSREPTSARRLPSRSPKQRILVYCNGSNTEPAYLNALRHTELARSVVIDVRPIIAAPAALIYAAIRHAEQSRYTYDQIWRAFDVDEFDIQPAIAAAAAQGVQVAVSNPCFELWLLLHHDDCRAHQSTCDSVISRLKKHRPRYDKTRLVFADFEAGVPDAVKRAIGLEQDGVAHPNPSTGMGRLVETLMGQGDG
jgi:hypothetical protein